METPAGSSTKPATQRSPFEKTGRTLRENMTAEMQHHTAFSVSPPKYASTIVSSAHTTLGDERWKKLVKDEAIVAAANALQEMGYSNTKPFDHAVTYLLNSISKLYVETVYRTTDATAPAVVFSGTNAGYVPGDYLATNSKPDSTAFISTFAFLLAALAASKADAPFLCVQEWTNILGLGEWKPKNTLGIIGQLLWYIACLKRFRPDFKTVYGISIENNTVRILSHTACGSTASSPVPLNNVETWVAFVVHCYSIYETRDMRFESMTRENSHARWLVRTDNNSIATLRPFHAGTSPGRVTWLSFEQDASSPQLAHLATGFLKVSWQDVSAQWNEPALLELAHAGGWLPGLVRHRWAKRDTLQEVSQGNSTRVKEIVHLASIGEPLSQCKSVLHLFKVLFDAIGVHQNLLKVDILHRDLSWFNILCNPWHDPATLKNGKEVKEGAPSIDYIMTGEESDPCVLVLDLDHGAIMTELYSPAHKHRASKSGTPMFVSVELSAPRPQARSVLERTVLVRLQVIDDPRYADLRKRACPGDRDVAFMAAIADVVERENKRVGTPAGRRASSNPLSLHRPRHDMESLFWVTLWALIRASPIPGCAVDMLSYDTLCTVGNNLLDHKLGSETNRASYLTGPPVDALHPAFERYKSLIADMAMYISIPWELYETIVPGLPDDHAHIAFRRMFLSEICKLVPGGGVENILFNRKKPRTIRTTTNFGQDRVTRPSRDTGTPAPAPRPVPFSFSGVSNSSAFQQLPTNARQSDTAVPPLVLNDTPSQRGSKRSVHDRDIAALDAEEEVEEQEQQPARKRLRATTLAQARPDADKQQKAKKTDGRTPIVKLIKAFWDDRILWFGVGDYEPERPANEVAAEAAVAAIQPDSVAAADPPEDGAAADPPEDTVVAEPPEDAASAPAAQ